MKGEMNSVTGLYDREEETALSVTRNPACDEHSIQEFLFGRSDIVLEISRGRLRERERARKQIVGLCHTPGFDPVITHPKISRNLFPIASTSPSRRHIGLNTSAPS